MGLVLIVIGLIWAAIGAGNIIGYSGKYGGQSTGWDTFAVGFNMVVFILPGLVVAGIGVLIQQGRSVKSAGEERRHLPAESVVEAAIEQMTKKCPQCAEYVKFEAVRCRFCGHQFDTEATRQEIEQVKARLQTDLSQPPMETTERSDAPWVRSADAPWVRSACPNCGAQIEKTAMIRSLSTRMRQWVHEISVGAPPRSLGFWVG